MSDYIDDIYERYMLTGEGAGSFFAKRDTQVKFTPTLGKILLSIKVLRPPALQVRILCLYQIAL